MENQAYRELIERSHQLHELRKHPGWAILVDYMETVVMKPLKHSLLNGTYDTLEHFKSASGFCSGASRVLKLADEIGEQVERERDRRAEWEEGQRLEAEGK